MFTFKKYIFTCSWKCKALNNGVQPQWQKPKRTKDIFSSCFQAAGPSWLGVTEARARDSWSHPIHGQEQEQMMHAHPLAGFAHLRDLPGNGYPHPLIETVPTDVHTGRANADSFPGESTRKVTTEGSHLSFSVPCGKHQPPLALIFTRLFCCSWILTKNLGTILFTLSSQHFTLFLS